MPDSPHLSVRELHKQFVLHLLDGKCLTGFTDVSFDVPATRFVGIAGRSGSGKSSLLKCIYRTYLADGGSMLYRRSDGSTVDLATADDDTMLDLRAGEIGYVSEVYVAEPFRNTGVGRTLMSRAVEVCARALHKHVFIGVDATNGPAMHLYRRFGFVRIGTFAFYSRTGL